MAMYEYMIAYRSTAADGNVDAMSRLPLPESPQVTPLPPEMMLLMEELHTTPIAAERIRVWTNSDPLCSRVRQFVRSGWPDPHRMYSSSHLQPGKMSCQCKMVVIFGETEWSFSKQAVVTC